MLDFISIYWSYIVIGIVSLIGISYFYKKGNMETVRKIILSLVVFAEKELGSKTGKYKYALVIHKLYELLPLPLRLLITKKEIENMIEEAVQNLKEFLVQGNSIQGYRNK